MNVLAYDNNVYLVNLDKNSEDVYIVNIKQGVIQGYDNIHKIMRFGVYEAFDIDRLNKIIKWINEDYKLYFEGERQRNKYNKKTL